MYGNSKSSNFAEVVVNADSFNRIVNNYTILPILSVNNKSQTRGVIMSYMVRTIIFLKSMIAVQQYRKESEQNDENIIWNNANWKQLSFQHLHFIFQIIVFLVILTIYFVKSPTQSTNVHIKDEILESVVSYIKALSLQNCVCILHHRVRTSGQSQ